MKSLQTNRLILDTRTREDLLKLLACNAEIQMEMLGISNLDRLSIELERINRLVKVDEKEWVLWDISLKNNSEIIGSCGFHNINEKHKRAELGYWLNEKSRNQGLMSEAIKAIVFYGFNSLVFNRIEAYIEPLNEASKRLVMNLDFQLEGILRKHHFHNGVFYDSEVYGLLG